MGAAANKATIREFFAAIDRAQSMTPLDVFGAPEYKAYFPGVLPMNRDAMKGYGDILFGACSGVRHILHDLVAEEDMLAARVTVRGVQTKPLLTPTGIIPPEGRPFALEMINLFRFADGKIAEHRALFDSMSFLQQIGATVVPETLSADGGDWRPGERPPRFIP